jgi:sugar lactone lactonase YvrE
LITRSKIEVTIALLLVLSVLLPLPHVAAFSINPTPVIRIGEWKSSSYGILNPWGGLAFDPSGNLWVADSENNRVLSFSAPFSDNMSASIVIGQSSFEATQPGVGAGEMRYPENVAFDNGANLWVSDVQNSRVLEFRPPFRSGMNASIVIGQWNFSAAFFNTTQNGLSGPGQIAFDALGNLWVADEGNSRVLEFRPPFNAGMNASLVIGEPHLTHRYCEPPQLSFNGVCSNHSTLKYPSEIAFDPAGDLWVVEAPTTTGRLLEFKPPFKSGMNASLVLEQVFADGITFDSTGNLWLSCGYCYGGGGGSVVEYRPPFNQQRIMWENGNASNADFVLGQPLSGESLPTVLVLPLGLTFDSTGNLWVVDARSSWLTGLLGRIVSYDAGMHRLDTPRGRFYFQNHAGLLAPLSAITATVGLMSYPYGLFNFTIQGLQPGGSVKLTITFPTPLPSEIGWWTLLHGNPTGNGEIEFSQLPQSQTQVDGNNMTLTLTNASREGVISVVGGPALPPTTSRSITPTSPINMPQTQSGWPTGLAAVLLATAIIVLLIFVYRKRRVT